MSLDSKLAYIYNSGMPRLVVSLKCMGILYFRLVSAEVGCIWTQKYQLQMASSTASQAPPTQYDDAETAARHTHITTDGFNGIFGIVPSSLFRATRFFLGSHVP